YIDVQKPVNRSRYADRPEEKPHHDEEGGDPFKSRFTALPGEAPKTAKAVPLRARIPPRPEYDLLWFIANYAPDMEDWARDIFLAVREESYYFLPVFSCQIMNEGWASHWHAKLLREATFLPQDLYLDAMKTHSDVVRPYAGDNQVALSINPYHLGFMIWDRISRDMGDDEALRIRREEDDFSFVRNYLDVELARELNLFVFQARRNGEVRITSTDLADLHETLLAPKYNFGAPRVAVDEVRTDGTLVLRHDYQVDGRGLDLERARKVLAYIHSVWHRPVLLYTVDARGETQCLERGHGQL
ncbi:MAG: SpoVR family protein, partial [Pseudomonadota bacterium]|nr:SpoVR family protein [Pseudomonadota bacterium]